MYLLLSRRVFICAQKYSHTHTHTAHPCKPMDYNNMSASEPTNMKHILQLANIQCCCALFFCYTTLLFVTCCCLEQPCTPCFAFVEALSLLLLFSLSLFLSHSHTKATKKTSTWAILWWPCTLLNPQLLFSERNTQFVLCFLFCPFFQSADSNKPCVHCSFLEAIMFSVHASSLKKIVSVYWQRVANTGPTNAHDKRAKHNRGQRGKRIQNEPNA